MFILYIYSEVFLLLNSVRHRKPKYRQRHKVKDVSVLLWGEAVVQRCSLHIEGTIVYPPTLTHSQVFLTRKFHRPQYRTLKHCTYGSAIFTEWHK